MAIIYNHTELRSTVMLQLVMMIANNFDKEITTVDLPVPLDTLPRGRKGRKAGRQAGRQGRASGHKR